MTTVGFELEFETNAERAIKWMHDNQDNLGVENLIGMNCLHRYHCDCPQCDLDPWHLRGQADSTCSGEVITKIYDLQEPDDSAALVRTTEILQEAAIAVDAEPGLRAGLHVHVGIGELTAIQHREAFYQFCRWENYMTSAVAIGRFGVMRTMNRSITADLTQNLRMWIDDLRRYDYPDAGLNAENPWTSVREATGDAKARLLELMYSDHGGRDRHSNLCTRTNYDTWEFRLWNSTRSAWRMQLAVGLSALWVDETFTGRLASVDVSEADLRNCRNRPQLDSAFREAVGEANSATAELLDRQMAFNDAHPGGAQTPLSPALPPVTRTIRARSRLR